MLRDILKLKGVNQLDKRQQKALNGGIFDDYFNCPTFCQTREDCITDDCGFTRAICATGTCLLFA